MKPIVFIYFFFISCASHAQMQWQQSLADSSLFASRIKGHVVQLYRWKDKLGLNHLVMTETPEFKSRSKTSTWGQDCEEEGCTDKELYAYHFLNTDSLLWKITDFQKACSVDNIVAFRHDGARLTDLDRNGTAETWFMYSLTCTSDLSPRTLKLVMHQGHKKYMIRGSSQPAKQMPDQEYGGKYQPDTAFSSLPPVFKNFAKKLWSLNLFDYSAPQVNAGEE